MASKALPSPEVLRQLLRYEPDTGKLFWKERGPERFVAGKQGADRACRSWNTRFAGREAFTTINCDGYKVGRLLDQMHRAHRVIWALVTGSWPDRLIDHRDGITANNAWLNLRQASDSQNGCNKRISSRSTTGVKGVFWHKSNKKWVSIIRFEKRSFHLGNFSCRTAAAVAYAKASVKLHGEFGRIV